MITLFYENYEIPKNTYEYCLKNFMYPNYDKVPKDTIYHNTHLEYIDSIAHKGILVSKVKQLEYQGNMIWATTIPNQKGYGGVTVAFNLNNVNNYEKVNNEQYCIYQDIPIKNIIFFDLPVCASNNISSPYRLSDISRLVKKHGKEKVITITNKMSVQYIPIETILKYI